MKNILIGICLMGLVMSATYHLYGMKITVDGDLDEARRRAHLAQKLMFQTKMLNVNNLDIVQNNLRLNDGTHVYVLSQHGLDSAQIYVPPKPVAQVPRRRERIEQLYWPAWEAHDSEGNQTGYVIARGGGFNPPYEYIMKQDSDKTDVFEWGQWLENYETRPFDDLEEYLKPKFVYTDNGRTPDEIERVFDDIPPAGTRNRLFIGLEEESYSTTLTMGSMLGCEQLCTLRDTAEDDDLLESVVSQAFTLSQNCRLTQKFTYSDTGEYGEVPEEVSTPMWWRGYWDYQPTYLNADENDLWPVTYGFGVRTVSLTGSASGVASTQHNFLWEFDPLNCEELKGEADDVSSGCVGAYSAHSNWNWDAILNTVRPVSSFFTYADGGPSLHPPTTVENPNPAWELFVKSFSATFNASERSKKGYDTNYSSVEDASHFGVVYGATDITTSLGFSKGDTPFLTLWDTRTPAPYGDMPNEPTGYNIEVVISGEEFTLDIGNGLDRPGCLRGATPRYYRVNSLEVLLGSGDLYKDSTRTDREFHYFSVFKTPDNTRFDDSVTLDRLSSGMAILPDITNESGEPVYVNEKIRLIRETKVVKEQ